MTSEFDKEALTFINKVSKKILSTKTSNEESTHQMRGIPVLMNLGEVQNFGLEEFDPNTYLTKRKFRDVNGVLIGLDTDDYAQFKELIFRIFSNSTLSENCDFKTLLDISFDWLLKVYATNVEKMNLSLFLRDTVDSLIKDHEFYFSIKALGIERPIQIGNVTIKFFNEDDITYLYSKFKESKSEKSLSEFKEWYGLTPDAILAVVKVRGVVNRATEMALGEAELAIDVLQCFCSEYSTDKAVLMFDIDSRFKQRYPSHYFLIPNNDMKESEVKLEIHGENAPIRLTSNYLSLAEKKGLKIFSHFIQLKKTTELYHVIIDLIRQFANITVTYNNYERTVKAISFFESICVPKNSPKAKGERILKRNIIPKLSLSQSDKELFEKLVRQHYDIRDKYLHNYIHLPINKKELALLLEFQRAFILKLIFLNERMNTVAEVLKYFDVINV